MRSLQLERSAGCGRGHEGLCDDEQSYDSTRNVVPTCASDIGRSRAIAHESVFVLQSMVGSCRVLAVLQGDEPP